MRGARARSQHRDSSGRHEETERMREREREGSREGALSPDFPEAKFSDETRETSLSKRDPRARPSSV